MRNKSNCWILLTILLLSVSLSGLSQSDTVCYTSEQNKAIAEGLLKGKQCENNITQMRLSYSDCSDQITVQGIALTKVTGEKEELEKSGIEKDIRISALEKKVRKRNKAIIVLAIYGAISTAINIVK